MQTTFDDRINIRKQGCRSGESIQNIYLWTLFEQLYQLKPTFPGVVDSVEAHLLPVQLVPCRVRRQA